MKPRGKWSSTLGFILATSGAAIGLGNIQRFPYLTAEAGGAAFVLIYIGCVFLLGIPLILTELALGRHTQKNPIGAIDHIRPGSRWKGVGALGILIAFAILTYYSVVGGWTLGYMVQTLFKIKTDFAAFTSSPLSVLGYMALFLTLTMLIVTKGVKKGIERYNKIFMPLLLIIILFLAIRSLSLPNSFEGLKFYLKPNFSGLTPHVFLLALGQAFFSLSIGEAVLITYGSYTSKEENLPRSATTIALFDLLIALLAGFVIFPALASFGIEPKQGVGLSFVVLPQVFVQMPFGNIIGALFFLLLAFAAITTAIALLEMPVSYLIDAKHWSRKKAVWIVGTLAFVIGIPSALNTKFYTVMDFIFGNIGMVLCGGLLALFVGWVWGSQHARSEILIGSPSFKRIQLAWSFIVKFLAPALIVLILLSLFF